jgi:HAD superfamily hydrolase (TIGR01509 family)
VSTEAVIFDLDGVLLDSEQLWNVAKQDVVGAHGGRWRSDAPHTMMGMSSPEWSRYLHDELGVELDPADINAAVVGRMQELYRRSLPLLPGAVEAVRAVAQRWPLGLASSSNREIIDLVLDLAGLSAAFAVTVSSEEVSRGKPAPDVYLEAAARLHARPAACVAVEDSSNGLRAAAAAGMTVIATPNPHYPPGPDALALARTTLPGVNALTPEVIDAATVPR